MVLVCGVFEQYTGGREESPFSPDRFPFLRYLPLPEGEDQKRPLRTTHFNRFILVDKEDISENGTVLTLQTNKPSAWKGPADPYAEFWEKGTWSVEIKQPQLQISRRYTPLPPLSKEGKPHWELVEKGLLPPWQKDTGRNLRILVRREPTGEVSNYLHNIPLDTRVEMRGGFTEFEVPKDVEDVLFLAGGTGIAPAIQVAHCLAERGRVGGDEDGKVPVRMHVLWANRKRDECAGAERLGKSGEGGKVPEEMRSNSLVKQLENLREKSKGLDLTVDLFVDVEGSFIREAELECTLTRVSPSDETVGVQKKRLVLVSGPDGFVQYLAGPKAYRTGKEYPGVTGGVLSRINLHGWEVQRL